MKLKIDNKGVSMSMAIGLLLLLVMITATVSELVIRALRASHQIEASDKAYFAAEGGLEDALYELSAHSSGYETPDLTDKNVRQSDFTQTVAWRNKWDVKSKDLNACKNDLNDWTDFKPTYCGQMSEGQKLVIPLFTDKADSLGVSANGIGTNKKAISKLNFNALQITFRIPTDLVAANPSTFSGITPLMIDNDGDYNPGSGTGLNEDGTSEFGFSPTTCPYSGGVKVNDNDCDGREDEDSEHDTVILWKLTDNQGYSFQPLRGCKTDPPHSSHPGQNNASLCEKDFTLNNGEVAVSLNETDMGTDQDDVVTNLTHFINSVPNGNQLQMEFLIVAPMQAVDVKNGKKIPIPYFEYGIDYNADQNILSSNFFSIKSDGYYQDFKQSITTKVIPQSTNKLLDLTILQQ